jgi:hypothetical protein
LPCAAEGDPRVQYAIAIRYAQGQGTAQNFSEASRCSSAP